MAQQKRDWEERTGSALSHPARRVLVEAGLTAVNPSPSAAPPAPQRAARGARHRAGIAQQVPGSARGGSRR